MTLPPREAEKSNEIIPIEGVDQCLALVVVAMERSQSPSFKVPQSKRQEVTECDTWERSWVWGHL